MKDHGKTYLFYRAVAKRNISTIGYCSLLNPLEVQERYEYPILQTEFEYEKHGIEDPRIVKIEDIFYLTYIAYDGINALGALAISKDLKNWQKLGSFLKSINLIFNPDITWMTMPVL
ncbi:hypothetical protein LNP04_04870 [Chryseobacterium sp. C-71]|uniref:glycoside hydrolase family 130 protein n=1 Tax=Chryseobacterium sp. C-71 TaxID=2893882 RepID=UPI001E37D46E|nr:hypothetical protein [Chryseobacterium sp. C-71]UFH33941.1 hypothetical protein LNP04_04870 [Chryseobacterium sp. C-71]